MNAYMIIAIDATCKAVPATEELYPTWEAACEAQEALEALTDAVSFLIYTADEWMYEVENGRT